MNKQSIDYEFHTDLMNLVSGYFHTNKDKPKDVLIGTCSASLFFMFIELCANGLLRDREDMLSLERDIRVIMKVIEGTLRDEITRIRTKGDL